MRSHARAKVQALRVASAALRKKARAYDRAPDNMAAYNATVMNEAATVIDRLVAREVKKDSKVRAELEEMERELWRQAELEELGELTAEAALYDEVENIT